MHVFELSVKKILSVIGIAFVFHFITWAAFQARTKLENQRKNFAREQLLKRAQRRAEFFLKRATYIHPACSVEALEQAASTGSFSSSLIPLELRLPQQSRAPLKLTIRRIRRSFVFRSQNVACCDIYHQNKGISTSAFFPPSRRMTLDVSKELSVVEYDSDDDIATSTGPPTYPLVLKNSSVRDSCCDSLRDAFGAPTSLFVFSETNRFRMACTALVESRYEELVLLWFFCVHGLSYRRSKV